MTRLLDTLSRALPPELTVGDEIGAGGMAVVFRGRDTAAGRDVAIKVLRPEIARLIGPQRFDREIAILRRLTHPNIVPLLGSGMANDLPYLVMPYVSGASLRGRIAAAPRGLPLDEVGRIAGDVAAALDHAHALGIIHRDVKPENILLDGHRAIVADFGLARAIETAGGDTLSSSGLLLGTPEYMSPEQSETAGPVGTPSDIYAFGCVLYEMLAGDPPFSAATAQATLAQHQGAVPGSIRVVRPEVPGAMETAVFQALAKRPAERPASGGALVRALTAN